MEHRVQPASWANSDDLKRTSLRDASRAKISRINEPSSSKKKTIQVANDCDEYATGDVDGMQLRYYTLS